jgi:hypothetical protein
MQQNGEWIAFGWHKLNGCFFSPLSLSLSLSANHHLCTRSDWIPLFINQTFQDPSFIELDPD